MITRNGGLWGWEPVCVAEYVAMEMGVGCNGNGDKTQGLKGMVLRCADDDLYENRRCVYAGQKASEGRERMCRMSVEPQQTAPVNIYLWLFGSFPILS